MEEILNELAPCGLSCKACFAYSNGNIGLHAQALRENLGNFGPYAKRFSKLLKNPVFDNYPAFNEFLELLSKPACKGCRIDACLIFEGCKVRACSKEKGVLFCYECTEFPCNDTGFDEGLYLRWIAMNTKMKESGVKAYYSEAKKSPRYK